MNDFDRGYLLGFDDGIDYLARDTLGFFKDFNQDKAISLLSKYSYYYSDFLKKKEVVRCPSCEANLTHTKFDKPYEVEGVRYCKSCYNIDAECKAALHEIENECGCHGGCWYCLDVEARSFR